MGIYNVSWKVERGQIGVRAGAIDFSAESLFDPHEYRKSLRTSFLLTYDEKPRDGVC